MTRPLDPPFGSYALPPARERWRKKAGRFSDTKWGRAMISRCRKKALLGQVGPFDVEVAPHIRARLYPSTNRCEKRAFAGVQVWDKIERNALRECVKNAKTDQMVFIDVGANVGLYSLFTASYAHEIDKPFLVIAVEPDTKNSQRLKDNIAASALPIKVVKAAISDTPGKGYMTQNTGNRGETFLADTPQGQEPVVVDTLARLAGVHGLTHINAMKIDIEGHDYQALSGFFKDAPAALYPDMLIAETGKETTSPLVELCLMNGYRLDSKAGLNSIFTKEK